MLKFNTIVISAGHSPFGDPGATVTSLNGTIVKEADTVLPFRDALVSKLRESLGNVRVISISDYYSLKDTIRQVKGLNNKLSGVLAIEIHMNAYSNPNAKGVEVFVHDNAKLQLKNAMRKFTKNYSSIVGTPNRGVKYTKSSAHSRLAFIDDLIDPEGRGVGVIVELGFLTNVDDCAWALHPDAPSVFADVMFDAIAGSS